MVLVLAVKLWDARAARVRRATFETRINVNSFRRNWCLVVSDRAIDLILSAVRIADMRNADLTISKIRAQPEFSGKVPIILAVELW